VVITSIDLTTVEDWPAGGFTLLKPKTGCPSGFLEGQIQFTTKYTAESIVNSAFMTHDGTTWTQSFLKLHTIWTFFSILVNTIFSRTPCVGILESAD
jgi:hypothetical protein